MLFALLTPSTVIFSLPL